MLKRPGGFATNFHSDKLHFAADGWAGPARVVVFDVLVILIIPPTLAWPLKSAITSITVVIAIMTNPVDDLDFLYANLTL
jgi:hypothetical protein